MGPALHSQGLRFSDSLAQGGHISSRVRVYLVQAVETSEVEAGLLVGLGTWTPREAGRVASGSVSGLQFAPEAEGSPCMPCQSPARRANIR